VSVGDKDASFVSVTLLLEDISSGAVALLQLGQLHGQQCSCSACFTALDLNMQMQLIRLPVQRPLPLSPCRPRASAGGHPPSQEPQVCTQCKRELAANWFANQRTNLSGRHSKCRLSRGCLNWRVLLHLVPLHTHLPGLYAACQPASRM
jgi:hypothetical protein